MTMMMDVVVAKGERNLNKVVRIDYDDNPDEVLEKIDEALEELGISFEDDEQEHDAFCLYEMKIDITKLTNWLFHKGSKR